MLSHSLSHSFYLFIRVDFQISCNKKKVKSNPKRAYRRSNDRRFYKPRNQSTASVVHSKSNGMYVKSWCGGILSCLRWRRYRESSTGGFWKYSIAKQSLNVHRCWTIIWGLHVNIRKEKRRNPRMQKIRKQNSGQRWRGRANFYVKYFFLNFQFPKFWAIRISSFPDLGTFQIFIFRTNIGILKEKIPNIYLPPYLNAQTSLARTPIDIAIWERKFEQINGSKRGKKLLALHLDTLLMKY